jgi:hypothetical protein
MAVMVKLRLSSRPTGLLITRLMAATAALEATMAPTQAAMARADPEARDIRTVLPVWPTRIAALPAEPGAADISDMEQAVMAEKVPALHPDTTARTAQ